MGLPWIRLDTSTFDHPKILALTESGHYKAVVSHLSAMTYTAKHGLDGLIPRTALRTIGASKSDAEKLVTAGLWDIDGEHGWEVHGWSEYQLSSEEHEQRRRRLSERGRKGADAKWKKDTEI